ncbi:hypothetical protein OPU39_15095, partial [Acinetobacter nosocomialis]|nr:hypothetical protein [Acinetobacter nosocomialis]
VKTLHENEEKTSAVEIKANQGNSLNALDFNLDLNPSISEKKSDEQVPSLDELTLVEQALLEATSIAPPEFSLGLPIPISGNVTGTVNNLDVNVAIKQSLGYFHAAQLNGSAGYLSVQGVNILWPEAASTAQTGLWLV